MDGGGGGVDDDEQGGGGLALGVRRWRGGGVAQVVEFADCGVPAQVLREDAGGVCVLVCELGEGLLGCFYQGAERGVEVGDRWV